MRTTYNSYVEMPDGIVIPLMISLPSNYNENKQYPLTIFLHGNGEFHTGYPNITAMYTHGITKEIKAGKLTDFQSIVVGIQGYSTNKQWWIEQIKYVIDLLTGVIEPKKNHRKDIIGSFNPLLGIKKYNVNTNVDFMCISQGGQGFSDLIKKYSITVGSVTLVAAYVTLQASDKNFSKIKEGVQVYHNNQDPTVGGWGAQQLSDKALVEGLRSSSTTYKSNTHDAWTKAFADDGLYYFHELGFESNDGGIEEPVIVEPEKPIEKPLTPGILNLDEIEFKASDGRDISKVIQAIKKGEEYPINWQNQTPYNIIGTFKGEATITKFRIKDGQGTCSKPNHTTFKDDKDNIIGEFTGGQYNQWYDFSTKNITTKRIIIENVQETKKNLPIGLEITVLK
jgi:hypothetical protein